jgi:hypothetical protein
VSGVIAMCYKAYIHVPRKKDRVFYKNWVQQKGGLHDVFKKYQNHLPKEFFCIFDNLDDCAIAFNLIDGPNRSILYKRILTGYFLHVQRVRNISSEEKIVLLCRLYSREYGKNSFFTNNVSKTLLKKILNMIFQSQHSDSILDTVVVQVKEGTPLRKILEKKLEKRKSHYN